MPKRRQRHIKVHEPGLPPGSLILHPEQKETDTTFDVIDFGPDHLAHSAPESVQDCKALLDSPSVTWLNVVGLGDLSIIRQIGEVFSVHSLVLEDIVSTGQRAKVEIHGDNVFFVVTMLHIDEAERRLSEEQVSIVLGAHYVITFQEVTGDVLEPVRERIRTKKGRVRSQGADYLTYTLIDVIVDHYYYVVEYLHDQLEEIEDEVFNRARPEVIEKINLLRKQANVLRRRSRQFIELFSKIESGEFSLIKKSTYPYLRDVQDHVANIYDHADSVRDGIVGLVDQYQSQLSARMNDVMKYLTMVGTIFIPLTFIAGVYGMNLHYMPGMASEWAFPIMMAAMVGIGVVSYLFFQAKTKV